VLIKAGVDISRLKPKIRKKLAKIEAVYNGVAEELVITSTYEGSHSPGSLHYANSAVDVRRPAPGLQHITRSLREVLGTDYDVVLETDHIHIEYDPD